MYLKEQKFITLFLIISLLILPMTLTANERRGADLVIYKTDGNQVRGELIAVKENSLLLKEQNSGADVTAAVDEINTIKIVKKSKTGKGAIYGFGIGAIGGGLIGGLLLDPEETGMNRANNTIFGLFWLGAFGALAGIIVGGFLGTDKTIQIEGKSDAEIKRTLDELSKKARVSDFQ